MSGCINRRLGKHLKKAASVTRSLFHLKLITTLMALLTAASLTPVFADDTEVFFGVRDSNTDTAPNVLFVLDTSGSMALGDPGLEGTRLERLRQAMSFILDSTSNVNVGLMRFNGFFSGGSVLYPITPIDELVCGDGECPSVSVSARVVEDNDDMEQYVDTGELTPTGTILSMGAQFDRAQLVGLRFQDVVVPSGATITSAYIDFTSRLNRRSAASLNIVGRDEADVPSISTTPNYLTDVATTQANVDWRPPAWRIGNSYSTPNLKDIVQEVVNRSDWCGGQSMGFVVSGSGERAAYAYNGGNSSRAPILRITYDSESNTSAGGCSRGIAVSQIKESNDDAYEQTENGTIKSSKKEHRIPQRTNKNSTKTITRLRFQDLKIPQGAVIDQASILFEVSDSKSGKVDIDIKVEAHDNAPPLVSNRNWISAQPQESGSVQWQIPASDNWASGTKVASPDVTSLLQKVVNRAGWSRDNAVAFQLSASASHSSNRRREFVSFDNKNSSFAPKLQVIFKTTEGYSDSNLAAGRTARDEMKQLIRELSATGGTPIVSAYLEASQYMLGGAVEYGKERGFQWQKHRFHRVSHPDSYTGGTVARDAGCTDENIESQDCKFEQIRRSPQYKSPIVNSCQTNHIVFLSDGAATSNTAADKVRALTGQTECVVNSGTEACGVELAQWLNKTDHNPDVARTQNISTYTIGFNNNNAFLRSLSTAGGGYYRTADSANELVEVFQSILGDVLTVDTSFVGPGATVNQFNRLTHRNDVYYAVFKPSSTPNWNGNLKRYKAVVNDLGGIDIVDRDGDNVLDEDTGFFSEESKSFWGVETDGNSVELGGAANQLSLAGPGGIGERNVYTAIGAIPAGGIALASSDTYRLHESNSAITLGTLGIDDSTTPGAQARRTELLKWVRGVDVFDEDVDTRFDDVRKHIGDPMHSQPAILNYKNGASTDTTIFVATNQGILHAIEHEQGTELFAFMPEALFQNIDTLYDNQQSQKHPYGLDGDLTIWHDDQNGNVQVDGNEKAYLFVGMRRGGNLYYGFDVSERNNPKLMWKIEGGTGDFQNLGQTWSRPIPTKIMLNGVEKVVLIFGGGYDAASNDANADTLAAVRTSSNKQPSDTVGNALFIADALTGQHLWSGQSDSSGSKKFDDMQYSFPSSIRVLDVNADNLADQLYVGDMGGQLWRFDIAPYHTTGDLVSGGVIASLNGQGIENSRRFYNEPDVALISSEGERYLSVGIGSGWRAHPLNTGVEDRFYMIRQESIFSKPDGYGKNTGTASSPRYEPLTETDLADVTDDLTPDYNAHGWMLKMEGNGEKILGASLTANNQFIFTTYQPTESADPCTPAVGQGYAYVVNALNGAPTVNLHEDESGSGSTTDSIYYKGAVLTKEDRKKQLDQGGILPGPSLLIVESPVTSTPEDSSESTSSGSSNSSSASNSSEGSTGSVSVLDTVLGIDVRVNLQSIQVDTGKITRRMYWQDKGRGNRTPDEIAPVASSEE